MTKKGRQVLGGLQRGRRPGTSPASASPRLERLTPRNPRALEMRHGQAELRLNNVALRHYEINRVDCKFLLQRQGDPSP